LGFVGAANVDDVVDPVPPFVWLEKPRLPVEGSVVARVVGVVVLGAESA
jgi:hypothetical protein